MTESQLYNLYGGHGDCLSRTDFCKIMEKQVNLTARLLLRIQKLERKVKTLQRRKRK